MAVEFGPNAARRQVPDDQFAAGVGSPVSAPREKPFVVGGNIRAVNLLAMLAPGRFLLPGFWVPEFDQLSIAGTHEGLALGSEGDGRDGSGMATEIRLPLAGPGVPGCHDAV